MNRILRRKHIVRLVLLDSESIGSKIWHNAILLRLSNLLPSEIMVDLSQRVFADSLNEIVSIELEELWAREIRKN